MGRRALPKISPLVDLSQHLLALETMQPPLDVDRCFGQPGPLEIEVGSGKGLFLTSAASATPAHRFLGIEIAGKYARYIAARLSRLELANARIVHGNAERLIREHLTCNSVRAVHIYFPDPWWKKRHHKRRIMNEQFLSEVARVLEAGGRLHFWTDVAEYFEQSLELLADRIPLEGPLPVPARAPAHDLDYRTHFERRTRHEGLPVYRAEFKKAADCARVILARDQTPIKHLSDRNEI
jgi:tRNA (guanine-N7-)-methyltransferase